MDTGVSIAISADNSAFLRGMEQTKAIARAAAANIQSTLAAIKSPPVPDIGKIIGIQKQQVFAANASILTDTKQTVAKLKLMLDEDARAYQSANKFRAPDMQRAQISGTGTFAGRFDHLAGTQYAGGRGPGTGAGAGRRRNLGYGAGVLYNFGQDYAQGGPSAVANNVPEILTLIAKSPMLQSITTVAVPAVLGFLTFSAVKNWDKIAYAAEQKIKELKRTEDDDYGIRYAQNKAASVKKQRERDFRQSMGKAQTAGENEGNFQSKYGDVAESEIDKMTRAAGLANTQADAAARLREAKLKAITDPAKLLIATAAEEKKVLEDRYQAEKKLAEAVMNRAAAEQAEAATAMKAAREELAQMSHAQLTPAELMRQATLKAQLPGLQNRVTSANARAFEKQGNLADVRDSSGMVQAQKDTVDADQHHNLAKIQEQAQKDRIEGEHEYQRIYFQYLNLRKNAEKELAATAKKKAQMEEQLEIAELQSGGHGRKAKRMEKDRNLRENTEKYKAAGFTEQEAAAMAKREQSMADRRAHPNRIRGAGSSDAPERASGLDYFDGKKTARPKTSALDEYERRRGIAGVGGVVDKGLAEREADAKKAASAPAAESSRVSGLLQRILNVLERPTAQLPRD